MSLDETLFVGGASATNHLPMPVILDHHATIRDAIAGTGHIEASDLVPLVADASFVYAFNAYKALGLLLPELYHESGAVVLRQLWEVSLNLHWIALAPDTRAQDFCNFTVMEMRTLLQKSGKSSEMGDFDTATAQFQSRFRHQDRRGRERVHGNFATTSVFDRANELGDHWKREYQLIYHLASLHAHGSPGAVLHGIFMAAYSDPQLREQNSTSLIATLAMRTIVRDVQLLASMAIIPDASKVMVASESFEKATRDAFCPKGRDNPDESASD